MSQATQSVETWHEFYDNPRDNTVLITKDNVKFRVSSRLLCKHSAIVNPLSSNIDVQDDEDREVKPNITGLDPIHLDVTCKDLELFLSMLSPITRRLIFASLTFDQCRDLLTFTEQYGCNELIPAVRTYLIRTAVERGQPTALFIFASDRDDWSLGRDAMKRMDAMEIKTYFGISWGNSVVDEHVEANARAFLNKLRPEWRQTLIPLLFFGILQTRGTQFSLMDWKIIADKFVKPVKSPKRKASGEATPASKKVRGG